MRCDDECQRNQRGQHGAPTSCHGLNLRTALPQRRELGALTFPAQHPRRYPVCDGFVLGAVGNRVRHQPPPVALLADSPAAQPALDDFVQLQAVGRYRPARCGSRGNSTVKSINTVIGGRTTRNGSRTGCPFYPIDARSPTDRSCVALHGFSWALLCCSGRFLIGLLRFSVFCV